MSDYSSIMNRHVTCDEHIAEVSGSIKSRFSQLVLSMKAYLTSRNQRRTDNKEFKYMLQLDDAMLKDIGVSRGDVVWAGSLPTAANASQELAEVAAYNRRSMVI